MDTGDRVETRPETPAEELARLTARAKLAYAGVREVIGVRGHRPADDGRVDTTIVLCRIDNTWDPFCVWRLCEAEHGPILQSGDYCRDIGAAVAAFEKRLP
jgi:hypothetical protein